VKIGITGQNGFIGWHLSQTIKYFYPNDFQLISFERVFFSNSDSLENFVLKCDCIVHLAGLNRAQKDQEVFDINININIALKEALISANYRGQLLFASSSQENGDTLYGKSKKASRELLEETINSLGGTFTGLIIPNVFGPFCKPNHNSFVATFCSKILNNETSEIISDTNVPLLYVENLVAKIIGLIGASKGSLITIKSDLEVKVSDVLGLLNKFKTSYIDNNTIPSLPTSFELNMFNTFRSYINLEMRYPLLLLNHTDGRGAFSELIKTDIGGQFSYSNTLPGNTRGNHFHTRKIERFIVIGGKAKISLRKIGSTEVYEFLLDGEYPSYVDMPIWYTHNITNIGGGTLITAFWINEAYNAEDTDTYFENV